MSSIQPRSNELDLESIQGDILSGLPKKTETYLFFQVTDVGSFKTNLVKLIPHITSTAQVLKNRQDIRKHKESTPAGETPKLIPLTGSTIAFSRFGLDKLGITDADSLDDEPFKNGQFKDAKNLADPGSEDGTPDWDGPFKEKIDGVVFVAGDCHASVHAALLEIRVILGTAIHEVTTVRGDVRPGKANGHEHFGYLDGISNPSIEGFDPVVPGPHQIKAGNILLKREGDKRGEGRPDWALDGSFLTLRYLLQRVPEFDDFLEKHPIVGGDLTKEEGSELRGARMVGRWKSGAPVELAPLKDDPELAKDPERRNGFRFAGQQLDQSRCPFAAHIRKTFPRDDLESKPNNNIDNSRIVRRGIPFGPEVTPAERESGETKLTRGLLFACYSSSITDGFQLLQQTWANAEDFPPDPPQSGIIPGFDGIIGQALNGETREITGTDPTDLNAVLPLPTTGFVVPRGGEYFFTPSIKVLKERFTQ